MEESEYGWEPPRPDRKGPRFLYLKNDGDECVMRIASPPYRFQEDWKGKMRDRFAWVVIHRSEQYGNEVKVYKDFTDVYCAVRALANNPAWGDPRLYDIKVERTGVRGSYYKVTPVGPKAPPSDEDKALVKAAGINLEEVFAPKQESDPAYDPFAEG